ncbi:MAG: F0F1 ATP synthase subunit epsilon [Thermodesulfobacteriota bacterium]|nr:F0F1 ATP synthase subunit epsilon [Thermodesulfobacteriota bacterium]
MAEELMLEIVTPEELAFSDKVEEVTVPGSEGEFGVLIGHVPLLSAVNFGELNYTKNDKKTYFAIGTGYAEVTDVKVTLLVESAVRGDEIDTEEAKREKDEAEAELSKIGKDDPDFQKVSDALTRAEVKLKVAEKL